MKAEHYDNSTLIGVDENGNHPQKDFLTEDGKLCCVIEGESWDAVMIKYHEHMGWEPYIPMEK